MDKLSKRDRKMVARFKTGESIRAIAYSMHRVSDLDVEDALREALIAQGVVHRHRWETLQIGLGDDAVRLSSCVFCGAVSESRG